MHGVPSPVPDNPTTEAPARPGLLPSNRWYDALLDLIFPPVCSGCGRVGSAWCGRCQRALDDLPLLDDLRVSPPLQGTAATALHSGIVQQAVHALKYDHARSLASPLSLRLDRQLTRLGWSVDLVAPVPMHRSRQRARGYNQAALLAEGVAWYAVLDYSDAGLIRERDTRSQVGMSGAERRVNVAGAFRGDPALLAARAVLLVDDVYTTGATLSACAHAALDAGAAAVYALTVTAAL